MEHDSLEMPVRTGAHNKGKAGWRTCMVFARQACQRRGRKFLCLGKLGFNSKRNDQLTRKILELTGTESCLLRPISRLGRHLITMVCDPPDHTNRPCRSMRKCPTTRIELGLSSAHPPLSEASFRGSQAFEKGKRVQNAASSSKGQEKLAPAAARWHTA
jgi:hypothetical protein